MPLGFASKYFYEWVSQRCVFGLEKERKTQICTIDANINSENRLQVSNN
jgi:hypothetical protein